MHSSIERLTHDRKKKFGKNFKGVYKVNVVGSSGSGKTTFLKYLLGDIFNPDSEALRRVEVEEKVDLTYYQYKVRKSDEKKRSTTTISFNVVATLMVKTLFNTIEFFDVSSIKELEGREDIEEIWQMIFFDNAGQDRFDFIPEITMPGTDAVIIVADGTNMSSIEKINYFKDMVSKEESKITDGSKKIPILIFFNKADLKERGAFIGLEEVKYIIDTNQPYCVFFETSMITGQGVTDAIHVLVNLLHECRMLTLDIKVKRQKSVRKKRTRKKEMAL